MRKWTSLVFPWIFVLALTACGQPTGSGEPTADGATWTVLRRATETQHSQPTDFEPAGGTVCHIGTETTYELTPEETEAIAAILAHGSWNREGTADCINDYQFTINGRIYSYHSECGTFQDEQNNQSLTATGTEKEHMNELLGIDNVLG